MDSVLGQSNQSLDLLQISPECVSRRQNARPSNRPRCGNWHLFAAVLLACLPMTIPAVCLNWWRTAVPCQRPIPSASSPTRLTRLRASPTAVQSLSARMALSWNIRKYRLYRHQPRRMLQKRNQMRRRPHRKVDQQRRWIFIEKIAI